MWGGGVADEGVATSNNVVYGLAQGVFSMGMFSASEQALGFYFLACCVSPFCDHRPEVKVDASRTQGTKRQHFTSTFAVQRKRFTLEQM